MKDVLVHVAIENIPTGIGLPPGVVVCIKDHNNDIENEFTVSKETTEKEIFKQISKMYETDELKADYFIVYKSYENRYWLYYPLNTVFKRVLDNYIVTTSDVNPNYLFSTVLRLQNELCDVNNELADLKKKFNDLYDMVMYHPMLGTIPDELKRDFNDKKNRLK